MRWQEIATFLRNKKMKVQQPSSAFYEYVKYHTEPITATVG